MLHLKVWKSTGKEKRRQVREETWLLCRGVLSTTFLPSSHTELLFTRSAYEVGWPHFISSFNFFCPLRSFPTSLDYLQSFLVSRHWDRVFLPWVTKPNGQSPNMPRTQGVQGFPECEVSPSDLLPLPGFATASGCPLPCAGFGVCQPLYPWTSSTHGSCRTWILLFFMVEGVSSAHEEWEASL